MTISERYAKRDKAHSMRKCTSLRDPLGVTWLQTDALRKFYTSLRTQRPQSEMARKW